VAIAAAARPASLAGGARVALAAPKAVTQVANPRASAARAVYCPAGEKKRRQGELTAFIRAMTAARKTYFASHPSAKDRTTFLHAQRAQLHALQRALAQCS